MARTRISGTATFVQEVLVETASRTIGESVATTIAPVVVSRVVEAEAAIAAVEIEADSGDEEIAAEEVVDVAVPEVEEIVDVEATEEDGIMTVAETVTAMTERRTEVITRRLLRRTRARPTLPQKPLSTLQRATVVRSASARTMEVLEERRRRSRLARAPRLQDEKMWKLK